MQGISGVFSNSALFFSPEKNYHSIRWMILLCAWILFLRVAVCTVFHSLCGIIDSNRSALPEINRFTIGFF